MAARGFLARFALVEPAERVPLALAFCFFLLVSASYFTIQPIRDALANAGGVSQLGKLVRWNLGVMLAVQFAFAALATRLPKRWFVPIAYHAFAAALLCFGALLAQPGVVSRSLGTAFYLFANVFNLFAMSMVWAVLASAFAPGQAQRLFGVIAVAGTLGKLAGSQLTDAFVRAIGSGWLVVVAAVLLEAGLFCALALMRRSENPLERAAEIERTQGGGAASLWRNAASGLLLVLRSRYLRGIALHILLYAATSTVLWMLRQHALAQHFGSDRDAIAEFVSKINSVDAGLTLVLQSFVTGHVLRRLGTTVGLVLLPAVTLLGFGLLAVVPALFAVATVEVLRKTVRYAFAKPAQESLYAVVSRAEKFQAKTFLDTLVYRAGDAIGSTIESAPVLAALGIGTLALLPLPAVLAWFPVTIGLGRAHRRKQAAAETTTTG